MGSLFRRLQFFFRRHRFDRDLADELRFHEEMKARALAEADGMSGDEARAAARRRPRGTDRSERRVARGVAGRGTLVLSHRGCATRKPSCLAPALIRSS